MCILRDFPRRGKFCVILVRVEYHNDFLSSFQLHSQWPANRQLRADIVREVILNKENSLQLLASQGIIFDANGGNLHLAALSQQRKIHKKQ